VIQGCDNISELQFTVFVQIRRVNAAWKTDMQFVHYSQCAVHATMQLAAWCWTQHWQTGWRIGSTGWLQIKYRTRQFLRNQ